MTQSILSDGHQEANYIKWIHAENRSSPEEVAAQTGLMQGSAGIGLWLLRLHAHQQNKEVLIYFPDEHRIKV